MPKEPTPAAAAADERIESEPARIPAALVVLGAVTALGELFRSLDRLRFAADVSRDLEQVPETETEE